MEYFTDALKNYANFSGSATRQQYWMFILFYVIFYICCAVIDGLLGMAALETILSIALLIPSISITTRRLHDIGKSGWWQLLPMMATNPPLQMVSETPSRAPTCTSPIENTLLIRLRLICAVLMVVPPVPVLGLPPGPCPVRR